MVVIHGHDPAAAIDEMESLQENEVIAEMLEEIARLLADQRASEFRVRAYHQAADKLRTFKDSLRKLTEREGVDGLIALPTIGQSIANLIVQYIHVGRMPLLDRLRGEETAERIFSTLPGIGPELSHRIYDYLHVESLSELYVSIKQGKLQDVPGIGRKRAHAIEECISERLRGTSGEKGTRFPPPDRTVSVKEILEIDKQYREQAHEDELPKIAPRTFNPENIAWLPILHVERGGRHFTALYSNSRRAHDLNTTRDWVVVYQDDVHSHGRWTVITSQFGKLIGCRIVRGREDECFAYYHARQPFLLTLPSQ